MCVHVQGLSEKYPVMYYEKATFTGEDKRYKKHCTQDNDALVLFKVGILGPHTVLPIATSCPVIFSWISSTVWNLFPFKGEKVLEKPKSHRAPNLGCSGGWATWVIWCFTKNSARDVMHERARCGDEAANHQVPIAAAFWIIWIVSVEECSSLTQNLMQIHFSTCSVILNDSHTVFMLTQWCLPSLLTSIVRLSLFMHAHSSPLSWLPGYMDVSQTILFILTLAGLFPDRKICTARPSEIYLKNTGSFNNQGHAWSTLLCPGYKIILPLRAEKNGIKVFEKSNK